MNAKLLKFVKRKYPDSKSDLFAIFLEHGNNIVKHNCFNCMVTMQSWMFLSSFEKVRKKLLLTKDITNLMHMENMVMGIAFGTAVSTFRNNYIKGYKGTYNQILLQDIVDYIPKVFPVMENRFAQISTTRFSEIPGMPVAYWVSENFYRIFENKSLYDFSKSPSQNVTGNNNKYVRKFWELASYKINKKDNWIFYAKGGGYRKWWGNLVDIVNWTPEARYIYQFGDGKHASQIINKEFWYKKGITWGLITSAMPSFRIMPQGATYDKGGSTIIVDDDIYYFTLGLLNSKLYYNIASMLNPTLNFQVKDVCSIPIIIYEAKKAIIDSIVKDNVLLSKTDWDLFENSWDFKIHLLLKSLDKRQQYKLSSVFNTWENECEQNFNQLKSNEEELNRIFIDIYGLQDELTPEVEDKDVTIRKADRTRDIKSLISYAVGCMFGRYSIDTDGLIYAGGEFNDKWNIDNGECKVRSIEKDEDGNIVNDSWVNASFVPDVDNIIPITEDEYFEDDIVSRFIEFIRTVYGEENLEENLDYIADSIGRKTSESSRQAIRRYFIKDFYKDHLKIYQKRPIYWMFDSGKNNGFKCLIYMHRYNDQTVAKVRTDYLHNLQRKYEAEINRQQLIVDSSESTTKDKTVAKKKIERINKQLEECREYDEVVAYLANEKISIDLDDGVKVNYAKFQNVKVINSKDKEVKMNLLAKI